MVRKIMVREPAEDLDKPIGVRAVDDIWSSAFGAMIGGEVGGNVKNELAKLLDILSLQVAHFMRLNIKYVLYCASIETHTILIGYEDFRFVDDSRRKVGRMDRLESTGQLHDKAPN